MASVSKSVLNVSFWDMSASFFSLSASLDFEGRFLLTCPTQNTHKLKAEEERSGDPKVFWKSKEFSLVYWEVREEKWDPRLMAWYYQPYTYLTLVFVFSYHPLVPHLNSKVPAVFLFSAPYSGQACFLMAADEQTTSLSPQIQCSRPSVLTCSYILQ